VRGPRAADGNPISDPEKAWVILLDENILEAQRGVMHGWRIRARQIGVDVASKGIKDEAIIPLLHDIGRVTFITRDLGFFQRHLVGQFARS
jgi:hypothetical protein